MPLEQQSIETVGKYRILGILGKGGMGIVYRGLDPDIERDVAIKTVRFDAYADGPAKEEMLLRVIREAKAAGRLNHPNIITIYDVIRESDLTFIVMQYIDGQTLQARIESGKPQSPRDVLAILKPIAEALDYAHENGIVHRDIKPANILIDKSGKPFLADFGVARLETSTMTGPGTTVGTLSYMSPEQVMGKTADGRADFFALGVILYELLTGRKPFAGDNLSTIVYKIVHEEPPSITEVNQDLPRGYENVIRRALAKRPEDRYQTGRELIKDLEDPENLSAASRDFELRQSGEGEAADEGEKKARPPYLALGLFVFALAVGGFLILRPKGGGEASGAADSSTLNKTAASVTEPAPAQVEPPPPAVDPPPADPSVVLADSLAKLRESFGRKDYAETIKLADAILHENPTEAEARAYRIKSKAELDAAAIAARLKKGIALYDSGDNDGAVRAMEDVLRLDEDNATAKDYLSKADTALSKETIIAMIESRRQAEERGELAGVVANIGPEGLASQERTYYEWLFMIYGGIQSQIPKSSIEVTFSDRTHATAGFHHAIQGVSRKDGKQEPVLYSPERWSLEKKGGAWKIVKIQERS